MKSFIRTLILAALLLPTLGSAAFADRDHDDRRDHHGRGHGEYEHGSERSDHRWHDDIHNRHGRDTGYWRTGHWYHGVHGGRDGRWWVLGPNYYLYAAPVYPYPSPYYPAAAAPVASGYAYFCKRPYGYYPYVEACAVPWRTVQRY